MRIRTRVSTALVVALVAGAAAACSITAEDDPAAPPVPEQLDLQTRPAMADLGLDADAEDGVLSSEPPVDATVLLPGATFTMPTATVSARAPGGEVEVVSGDTGPLALGTLDEVFHDVLTDLGEAPGVADEFVTAATTADADEVTSPWVNLTFGDATVGVRADYDPRDAHGRVVYSVTWS